MTHVEGDDYGHCPDCAKWVLVRRDGRLCVHLGRRGPVTEYRNCPGSGKTPGLLAEERAKDA